MTNALSEMSLCVRVVQIPENVTVSSDHDVVRKLGMAMGAVT